MEMTEFDAFFGPFSPINARNKANAFSKGFTFQIVFESLRFRKSSIVLTLSNRVTEKSMGVTTNSCTLPFPQTENNPGSYPTAFL